MDYVGIDFHKEYSFVTEMDEAGVICRQAKLANDPATLKGYLNSLPSPTKIAIETIVRFMAFSFDSLHL